MSKERRPVEGEQLRHHRERLGLLQAELAASMSELGTPMTQPILSRIESGRRPLRFREAVTASDAMGINIYEFCSKP